MRSPSSRAEALLAGQESTVAEVARQFLKPLKTNFVERPWGGMRIRRFKGLCPLPDQSAVNGLGLGEAFELAAWDADDEARARPSRIRFSDGSEVSLPELLHVRAAALLGQPFVARYGRAFPLLPKILDIKELLSVQGHPAGHTEVYVIIDAEPGATVRLGFCRDIQPRALQAELTGGRRQQQALWSVFSQGADPAALQGVLGPWLAQRHAPLSALPTETLGTAGQWRAAADLLIDLKALYWRVLDSMNVIKVMPGQVIHNANPPRMVEPSAGPASAEVHALGNPEYKEILALEIRRPGPTFRAWDNVRFPIRAVDVTAAIASLNLRRTQPGDFLVSPVEIAGRPGTLCSVDSDAFRVEHLKPRRGRSVAVAREPPHCLHAIRGRARFFNAAGAVVGDLARGESALVPIGVGGYRAASVAPDTEVIKVSLPCDAGA